MKELKEILGEELFNQIQPKLGEHSVIVADKDEKYIKDDGNLIPKSRFNELVEQKNTYKESVDDYKQQLDSLKGQLKDNGEVTKQINGLQEKLSQKDNEVIEISKRYALKDVLKESGAKYPDLLMTKFSLSELNLKDGMIENIEDKIKNVKTSYPDLFKTPGVPGTDDGRVPDPPKVQLTEAQRRDAHEKFPYQSKEQAERNWFDVLRKTGKI